MPSPTPSNSVTTVDRWRVYNSPDKSFTVEVPCELVDESNIGEYLCGLSDSDSDIFTVFVTNLSDVQRDKINDDVKFERYIKEDLFPPNRRVTQMAPIAIENGIAREILVTNSRDSDDNGRLRVMLVGSRIYHVGLLSSDPKNLKTPKAERFLSSFKPRR